KSLRKLKRNKMTDNTSYKLKIFNLDGTLDESARIFVGRYLNIKNKGEPGLGERVKANSLVQSDLFFLKAFLPKMFIIKSKMFSFKAN
ncbi:MAG: hypothetical protein WDA09_11820, partial [Bacteriovoracaceae bacterium]